jgi:hypothetical protein
MDNYGKLSSFLYDYIYILYKKIITNIYNNLIKNYFYFNKNLDYTVFHFTIDKQKNTYIIFDIMHSTIG